MAVKTARIGRSGRRVSLTRPGAKDSPGKNTRHEAPKRRQPIHMPWQEIRNFFFSAGLLSILLFFVLAVSFGLVYSYRALTTGEYFSLKTLEIQGNSRLTSREVLEAADLMRGGNTLSLSIDAVEGALSSHPWVEAASVKRVLPGALIIGLREKTPAFWVLHEGSLQYADAWGKLIAPVYSRNFASLPALEVEPGAEDATAALPDLVKSLQESRLPLNMAAISLVRLSAARGVEVFVEDSRLKISIGLEEWLPNLQRLGLTLSDLIRRGELQNVQEIKAQGANVWVDLHARRSS